ncbi:MAG: hypothetical protein KAS72_15725, partial [Phycisphaerales bacterium]|nr:hypothetical protein [Phycisphaerales bacterium]
MSTILSHYDFKPPGWAEFASPPSSSRNALKLAGTTSARVEIADSLGGAGPLNAAVTHRSILLRFRVDDPSVHPAQLYEEGGGHGIALGYDGTNLIGIIGVNAVPHQVQTPFAPSAGAMCEVLLRLTPQTGLELRLGDTEPVTLGGSFTIQAHNSGTAIGAVAGSAIPRSALGYFLPAFSQSAGADPAAVTLL